MTEEKKVITIDDVEYTEDQLSDEAKAFINHISRLDGKLNAAKLNVIEHPQTCLLYTSPSPRDRTRSRMQSSA